MDRKSPLVQFLFVRCNVPERHDRDSITHLFYHGYTIWIYNAAKGHVDGAPRRGHNVWPPNGVSYSFSRDAIPS